MSKAQRNATADPSSTASSTTHPLREARLRIDDDDLATIGIADLADYLRDADLRDLAVLANTATGTVLQIQVAQPLPERALASLTCVDQITHPADTTATEPYVITLTAPAFPASVARRRPTLLDSTHPTLDADGLEFSLIGPLDAVAATIDELETDGLSPELLRIGKYTGTRDPLAALTDRQYEVVRTAHDLGYYDVPRTVSLETLATELGVERSTVTEHLQRAARNLLAAKLSARRS